MTIYLFTDGGASANGSEKCKASWAYIIVKNEEVIVNSDYVKKDCVPASNNRGELFALYYGLCDINKNYALLNEDVKVVSDSLYSIKCITVWVHTWLRKDDTSKKNLDIIVPTKNIIDSIQCKTNITFEHIKSHKKEPANKNSQEWIFWHYNKCVDEECAKLLR